MVDQCTLSKPIMVCVPPGQIVIIPCPKHPEGHKIVGYGPVYSM